MRLTKATIDKLTYSGTGKARDVRWDDELPGFGVRVYPSGKRVFILSYRDAERQKRLLTLGPYGILTLQEARNLARRALGEKLSGTDPLATRKKKRQGETVADLIDAYIERHAKQHKRTWQKDESRLNRHVRPVWGKRKADSIARADVALLHGRIGKDAPYEANRTVEIIRKMWNLAQTWGFVPEDHPNPARGIQRYKEKPRDRWVTPDEMPRLAQAIDQEENPYVRAALWLYLLTGLRKNELLRAEWRDVDFATQILRVPETKSGRVHYVSLSGPAMQILNDLPREKDNPYILPGNKEGEHLVNMDKPWFRVRTRAKIADVRLHDLRRTVGSWLATDGRSLLLIGRVLNHARQQTTQIYAHLQQDPIREALERHASRILAAAGKTPGGVVVKLKEGAGD